MESSLFGTTPDTLGYVWAVMLISGGLLGAVRRGSLISLIAGALAAAGQTYGSHSLGINRIDIFPVMLVNSILFLTMAYRFFKTDKFMPAGLIMCLTCAQLARYGANMVE